MSKTIAIPLTKPKARDAIEVLFASLVIVFFAQVKIPYGPIPHTLQTFAVFLVALMMTPRKAAAACLCYLGYATLGLPVISGLVSNPMWLTGTTAGYLVGFPVAAYAIATVERMWGVRSYLTSFISILIGQVVLYTIGVTWLSFLIGTEGAVAFGLMPFLVPAFVKNMAAAGFYHLALRK